MQTFQEQFYDAAIDYRHGSPHLTHLALYDALVGLLRQQVDRLTDAGLPLHVLELGAGHGGFTEPMLAAGCSVTAVEMSQPSVAELQRRFGHNPSFSAVYDPDGSLGAIDRRFTLIVCVAVLHHIPDYLATVQGLLDRLVAHGAFVSLQDPLWYPRADGRALWLNRAGFDVWRVRQGDLMRGIRTRARRLRGRFDEDNPSDMVEYHVVRSGVDEDAVEALLRPRFDSVEVRKYWSNQSSLAQRIGQRLGSENSFGAIAMGYRPHSK